MISTNNMNKIAFYSTITVGVLLVGSFFPHAFKGIVALNDLISREQLNESTATGLKIGWIWGSITILILGVWCFFLAPAIRKGTLKAKAQIFLLGMGLSTFGFGTIIMLKEVNHIVLFGFEGLLLILPALFTKHEKNLTPN